MNRKLLAVLTLESLLIAAVIFVCFLMYTGSIDIRDLFKQPDSEFTGPDRPPVSNINKSEYMPTLNLPLIKADAEVFGGVVTVRQEIYLTEKSGSFTGYIFAANHAGVTIRKVGADTGITAYETRGITLEAHFSKPASVIYIDYAIELKNSPMRLAWSENMIKLTNFLITPAVYKDSEPVQIYKADFGDPFIYDVYDYNIRLSVENNYSVYAPGKISEEFSGDTKTYAFFASNMRDFPVIVCKDTSVTTVDKDGVKIYYINGAEAAAAFVEYSMDFAEKNIGAYPYSEFFAVKTDMDDYKGMEFSCMIFLDSSAFSDIEYLKSLTYHEVLHQWFYGIIGTDQLNEPFLDEGIVTYLAAFLRNRGGAVYYNSEFFDKKLSDYYGKGQYDNLAYAQAANYFSSVHVKLGDKFFEMLKQIYNEKAFKQLTNYEFSQYVQAYVHE